MFRPAARALVRAPAIAARTPAGRRLISSAAPTKSRSWKNYAVRLGLAAGAVYYYNTSSIFAAESSFSLRPQPRQSTDDESLPTLDSITPKIRHEKTSAQPAALEGGLNAQELEEEAGQEAAFNPETGEINWDCPCLGGMAHGPCGEEFKAAFSCFVYSQEEPKGIDCIEKFKGMQDCFRQYPDVYGAELEDDEEEGIEGTAPAPEGESTVAQQTTSTAAELDASSQPDENRARASYVHSQMKADATQQGEQSESDALLPKAWHDTEDKNESVKRTEK